MRAKWIYAVVLTLRTLQSVQPGNRKQVVRTADGLIRGCAADSYRRASTVVDGTLYLHHSLGARRTWLKDIAGNIAKANTVLPNASATP